ncbi:helix-turn-helix domain-containing protein [Lactobacillus jensenii]|uniref:Helix-turn-helix transcriptional regulator n=1 Tax=Lactobacillus jensenii TaxID=109790 RepID=A0A5N1IGG5_LACJE|nr:helix-turn-helix transcriptional regulator [Lactobacillus jensenii]KAA9324458.1 helix-turn-helix transcriptional regulator [Lactobacillus jensenii]
MTDKTKLVVKKNACKMFKEYLTDHGVKQSYVARSLGYSDAYVSRLTKTDFTLQVAIQISNLFDLPYDYFLDKKLTNS